LIYDTVAWAYPERIPTVDKLGKALLERFNISTLSRRIEDIDMACFKHNFYKLKPVSYREWRYIQEYKGNRKRVINIITLMKAKTYLMRAFTQVLNEILTGKDYVLN
jgi:hypothetical protein